MAAGASFHLHVLRARLFLTEHGIHRQLAELQLGVETEELLAALYQGCVERERYVGGFEELQYVVLLAFVLELYLVLEVKGSLGVLVDVEAYQVAYLSVEVDLQVLVEIEGRHTPLACVALRVVAVVVHYLERQLRTAAGAYLYLRQLVQYIQLLAYLVEARYLAQQAALGVVEHRTVFLLVPVVLQQLVHLPVLVLVEAHVVAPHHHVAHLGHPHIAAALRVVFHRRGDARRRVATPHGCELHTVVLSPCRHAAQEHHNRQYIPQLQGVFMYN